MTDRQRRNETPAGEDASPPTEWAGLAALVAESLDVARRSATEAERVRHEWGALARKDDPWTTDTIMNEVVNSWERVTPLWGEVIEKSIDLNSWLLQNFWPSASEDLKEIRARTNEARLGADASRILDVGEQALSRVMSNDYHSADAVEDWATTFGAAAKEGWRQATSAAPGPAARSTEETSEGFGPESHP